MPLEHPNITSSTLYSHILVRASLFFAHAGWEQEEEVLYELSSSRLPCRRPYLLHPPVVRSRRFGEVLVARESLRSCVLWPINATTTNLELSVSAQQRTGASHRSARFCMCCSSALLSDARTGGASCRRREVSGQGGKMTSVWPRHGDWQCWLAWRVVSPARPWPGQRPRRPRFLYLLPPPPPSTSNNKV